MTLASSGRKGPTGAPSNHREILAGLSKEEAVLTIASWYDRIVPEDFLLSLQASDEELDLEEFTTWLICKSHFRRI